jgi:hypothetical protein
MSTRKPQNRVHFSEGGRVEREGGRQPRALGLARRAQAPALAALDCCGSIADVVTTTLRGPLNGIRAAIRDKARRNARAGAWDWASAGHAAKDPTRGPRCGVHTCTAGRAAQCVALCARPPVRHNNLDKFIHGGGSSSSSSSSNSVAGGCRGGWPADSGSVDRPFGPIRGGALAGSALAARARPPDRRTCGGTCICPGFRRAAPSWLPITVKLRKLGVQVGCCQCGVLA